MTESLLFVIFIYYRNILIPFNKYICSEKAKFWYYGINKINLKIKIWLFDLEPIRKN